MNASSSPHRYFIELAFNGSAYHGWQIQKNAVSVQEVLNKALTTLLRQNIETIGCGRTDTGVHATQLYAHFDSNTEIDSTPTSSMPLSFIRRVNAILPRDIAVKRVIPVPPDAHARFDATLRSYEYHLHFHKNPFLDGFSWLLRDELLIERMNQAAKILFEYHDFSCFSKSNTQTFTNNCVISRAEWVKSTNGLIFHISADRFLRNMVRAIVGTLIRVGREEIKPEEMHRIIESKNRSQAGTSVPAYGLYLTAIIYPYIQKQNQ
jgi:tRNA pseudouridine38-40 synthase